MTAPTSSSPPPLKSALYAVTAEAAAELDHVWRLPVSEVTSALFDVLPPVIRKWNVAAASVAADWYDELRAYNEIPGRFSAIVPDLGDQGADALAGWGADGLLVPVDRKAAMQTPAPAEHEPVELDTPQKVDFNFESAQARVEGGLQKRLVNAANLTVTGSAAADPRARGYMRRTRPGACDFCKMVASRGAVYTKASATFACHEKCYCEAVPAWGGKALPVGPYKPSDRPNNSQERARVRAWIARNLHGKNPDAGNTSSNRTKPDVKPSGSKKDIAQRHLPILEKTLNDLRSQGLPENSPKIQYHLKTIARLRKDLQV